MEIETALFQMEGLKSSKTRWNANNVLVEIMAYGGR